MTTKYIWKGLRRPIIITKHSQHIQHSLVCHWVTLISVRWVSTEDLPLFRLFNCFFSLSLYSVAPLSAPSSACYNLLISILYTRILVVSQLPTEWSFLFACVKCLVTVIDVFDALLSPTFPEENRLSAIGRPHYRS